MPVDNLHEKVLASGSLRPVCVPKSSSVLTNAVMAQQIFGGHGYIAEHGMEQFVRDARSAQIYEGANGIQALDLVGRKLGKDGGRAIMAFFNEVQTYLKERAGSDAMNVYLKSLGASLAHLQQASMWFMQNAMAKPDNAGAGSYDYMHLFGLVALGYMWCRIAEAALAKLSSYVDQILHGAKPSDLPVQTPTKYELSSISKRLKLSV